MIILDRVGKQPYLQLRIEAGSEVAEGVLQSALGAKKQTSGSWQVGWPDLAIVREKLDVLGLDNRDATDAAMLWIEEQLAEDERLNQLKYGNHDSIALDRIKANLYQDQRGAVLFLADQKGAILADPLGSGKTICVLSAYDRLRQAGRKDPLLVICPNTVKGSWLTQCRLHTSFKAMAIGNGKAEIADTLDLFVRAPTDVLILHYDVIAQQGAGLKSRSVISDLGRVMAGRKFGAVIFDEAHNLKNLEAKRTQAARFLIMTLRSRDPGLHVWLATGTPVSESPVDAYSLLHLIGQQVPSQVKFYSHFVRNTVVEINGRKTKMEVGYHHLDDLKRLLSRPMIRREKSELKGFPDKVETIRSLQMTGSQARLYKDVKLDVLAEIDTLATDDPLFITNALEKLLRLRQLLISPELVGREGDSAKLDALDELLADTLSSSQEKVLIWTEYRAAVELIAKRYASYGVVSLYGGMPQYRLQELSTSWDTCQERIAVGIPAFAGTGIDFLSRCRTAIYLDVPYSTVLFRQSLDRIHRRVSGDTSDPITKIKASPAHVIFLHVADSVDDLVLRRVDEKASMVDSILTASAQLKRLGKREIIAHLGRLPALPRGAAMSISSNRDRSCINPVL